MAKKNQSEKPSPNIAFVGRGKNGFQPLRLINNGDATYQLPEDQSKPFFHEDAKTICRLFPTHYKPVRDK